MKAKDLCALMNAAAKELGTDDFEVYTWGAHGGANHDFASEQVPETIKAYVSRASTSRETGTAFPNSLQLQVVPCNE